MSLKYNFLDGLDISFFQISKFAGRKKYWGRKKYCGRKKYQNITFQSGIVFGSRSRSLLGKFWKCLDSAGAKYTAISRFCSSLGSQSRRKVTNRCIFFKSWPPALVSHLSWTMSSALNSSARELSPHVELRLRSHPCPEL